MPALTLNRVAMRFGPRALFAEISASVGAGDVLVVTGANGAGKSTLLKIAVGLARPSRGSVQRRGAVGYAAPDASLYGELTGTENLCFFARLRGLALPDDGAALLARVGLPAARGADWVSAYSSGMRQRLKLAVSLLGDPPLLVWDEPAGMLDAGGARHVEDILERHRRAGGLAVVATNDAAEAERWGTQRVHIGQ